MTNPTVVVVPLIEALRPRHFEMFADLPGLADVEVSFAKTATDLYVTFEADLDDPMIETVRARLTSVSDAREEARAALVAAVDDLETEATCGCAPVVAALTNYVLNN